MTATAGPAGPTVPRATRSRDDAPPPRGTVVDLYDVLRIARINVLYYGGRLWWLRFWVTASDVAIAVGTSSLVASAAFWSATGTRGVPLAMGLVAAVLSVVKPIVGLSKKVERVSGQWSGYLSVFHAADQVVRVVRADHAMTSRQRTVLATLHDRLDLLEKNDDVAPNNRRLDRAQDQVETELPVDDWWAPPPAA